MSEINPAQQRKPPWRRRFIAPIITAVSYVATLLDLRDLFLFIGCGLLGYGCSLIYWPAAFIVPGTILAGVAIFGTRAVGEPPRS